MIDSDLATLALRNRMLTLAVATTGSTTLSATSTGYTRATGSFLTDGFRDGMEFLAAGFATSGNNGYRVIDSVSALTIVTSNGVAAPTVEGPAIGRTLSVGLPQGRALDNKPFTPVSGRPYIEEDFVPGGHALIGYPSQGSRNEESGLYVIRYYGLEGKGEGGIRRPVDALKRLFAPGTVLSLSDGTAVRMSRDSAAVAGQILPQGDGWAVCVVSIPWRADTTNLITA
jgi:hypothetical protein